MNDYENRDFEEEKESFWEKHSTAIGIGTFIGSFLLSWLWDTRSKGDNE